ncbi:MAG TPA: 4Fe-4S binding protein, partial [Negativicutes bacterium]|nr:4Fe-4S binding protein [Negativicutes bacterium]
VYFSPTGTTKKVTEYIAGKIAEGLHAETGIADFTLPGARNKEQVYGSAELVVFGTPVYAGRVPNVLLPYLKEKIKADGALAVPVVLFGNRAYDDGLIELKGILENDGFNTIAAGAFIGEHSFSRLLAAGRPDERDILTAYRLSEIAVGRIGDVDVPAGNLVIPGEQGQLRPYYTPRDRYGTPISILKVKPRTNEKCTSCGACAAACPMGSISSEDYGLISGICIKCGACIKKCPAEAKYYDDEGYNYHKCELEELYSRRTEPEIW